MTSGPFPAWVGLGTVHTCSVTCSMLPIDLAVAQLPGSLDAEYLSLHSLPHFKDSCFVFFSLFHIFIGSLGWGCELYVQAVVLYG